MRYITRLLSATLLVVIIPGVAKSECVFKGAYLTNESGNRYQILSIRHCFGLDIKDKMKHFPKYCLTYNQAEKLEKKYADAAVMGRSIVEVRYKGKSIYLERDETAFASPYLSWAIYSRIPAERRNSILTCVLPYKKCDYLFDAGSSILTAELPRVYEKRVNSDQSNRDEIIEKYYGKIATNALFQKGCNGPK